MTKSENLDPFRPVPTGSSDTGPGTPRWLPTFGSRWNWRVVGLAVAGVAAGWWLRNFAAATIGGLLGLGMGVVMAMGNCRETGRREWERRKAEGLKGEGG